VNGLTLIGTAGVVLAVVAFTCIVFWAWSGRRKQYFDQAAQAPFALPDEAEGISSDNSIKQDIDQRGRQP
jgi:cbb3-type cytochrome oxidase subunit 3